VIVAGVRKGGQQREVQAEGRAVGAHAKDPQVPSALGQADRTYRPRE
jgi:hypothetical protein